MVQKAKYIDTLLLEHKKTTLHSFEHSNQDDTFQI